MRSVVTGGLMCSSGLHAESSSPFLCPQSSQSISPSGAAAVCAGSACLHAFICAPAARPTSYLRMHGLSVAGCPGPVWPCRGPNSTHQVSTLTVSAQCATADRPRRACGGGARDVGGLHGAWRGLAQQGTLAFTGRPGTRVLSMSLSGALHGTDILNVASAAVVPCIRTWHASAGTSQAG